MEEAIESVLQARSPGSCVSYLTSPTTLIAYYRRSCLGPANSRTAASNSQLQDSAGPDISPQCEPPLIFS